MQGLLIEETLPNEGYSVLWRGENPHEAINFMQACTTTNRIELWSKLHAEGPKGFAPMAWRQRNSDKVIVTHTFRMLALSD
jgi:hypothetical protein